jgi:hypothetical protein
VLAPFQYGNTHGSRCRAYRLTQEAINASDGGVLAKPGLLPEGCYHGSDRQSGAPNFFAITILVYRRIPRDNVATATQTKLETMTGCALD